MPLLRRPAGAFVVAVMALFLVGCSRVDLQMTPPTTSASPATRSESPSQSPHLSPSAPTSTPGAAARLVVSGSGTVSCSPYNGCRPVLVLGRAPARSLFALDVGDVAVRFEAALSNSTDWGLSGDVEGAPASIVPGVWAVAIGAIESSDDGTCESPCVSPFFPSDLDLRCVREFEVNAATERVELNANFDGWGCDIGIEPQPDSPPTTAPPVPVPPWRSPKGGILDDCARRPALFRIDADGRPWYEEIATGGRVESLEFEGWQAVHGDQPRIISEDGGELRDWEVTSMSCVFESGGIEWVGGPYEAWQPWDGVLGDHPSAVARSIFELERGHLGGSPPGAASLTSAHFEQVERQTLRTLDDEIRDRGAGLWSTVAPDFYLGDYAALANDIRTVSGLSFPEEDWVVVRDPQAGWRARNLRQFETPAGNTVSVLDETLLVWENCSGLIVPPITPGPIEPGVETGIDEDGGIVTVYIDDPDRDGVTLVAVAYEDPTCRAHPIVGPMIEHLLSGI